jgi:hypothetical protein
MPTAQQSVVRLAVKIANRRARTEILPLLIQGQSDANVKGLRRSWAPFKATLDDGEYGYRLETKDAMVKAILLDQSIYTQVTQIGLDSMEEAMSDSSETQVFVQSLLDGLRV